MVSCMHAVTLLSDGLLALSLIVGIWLPLLKLVGLGFEQTLLGCSAFFHELIDFTLKLVFCTVGACHCLRQYRVLAVFG